MNSGWRKKWFRLSLMSWDEIRTRVAQEVRKRLDLVRCRSGLGSNFQQRLLEPHRAAKFFFSPAELPQRIELLQNCLPQEVEKIVAEADAICRHEFDLLGYEKIKYGPDIDWHLDVVHGKRAPLKPWFKIDFLNFAEVGDHKVIWELNRHQHLVTLAKGWCFTGDPRYVQELCAQWYSWQKSNPYPVGVNWASSLEVAFRSMSWLWMRQLIAGFDSLPRAFNTDLLSALQLSGRHIERYLSTYFSPNTHLLGEAVALLYLGTLCPEIPNADKWQRIGWDIVRKESERQVRPDGIYFERSLYYHVYALDFFLYARLLASLSQLPIPAEFEATVCKMLNVLQAMSQHGPMEGFGDDDGGRVFNPRRNRVEHMMDPLAIGATLYDCHEYAAKDRLTEEAVWLFGERAVAKCAAPNADLEPHPQAWDFAGIYLLVDDEPCNQQMMIEIGPQGTEHSGHGHADALSISLSVNGQRVLIDPGTYVYVSEGDERNRFRGTIAHNTLRVDGVDQAVPAGPFAWTSIPHVKTEHRITGKSFDFFVGCHDGYTRLTDPVLHRRYIFHTKGGFWFIRDTAEARGSHLLELYWHFAPGLEVIKQPWGLTAKTAQCSRKSTSDVTGIALLPSQPSAWTMQLLGEFDSPAYGRKQDAPVASLSSRSNLSGECAVLLVPITHASISGTFAEFQERGSHVRAYRYDQPESQKCLFLPELRGRWTYGPWSSDASVLYCCVEHGRLTYMAMVAGSYANWEDKPLLALQGEVQCAEWLHGSVYSSDSTAVEHFVEENFKFFHPVL